MDKQLRIIAGDIVVESKLSKSAKLKVLKFIQTEATDAQIKIFFMDGKIVKLDEQAEAIVNDRFEVSEAGGRVAKLRKSYMGQAGSGSGLNVFWVAYRAIRAKFDKCTKTCGKYEVNTSRRQHCMILCKLKKAQGELAAAQKLGDAKKIAKSKAAVVKAANTAKKSVASFTKRGAEV